MMKDFHCVRCPEDNDVVEPHLKGNLGWWNALV